MQSNRCGFRRFHAGACSGFWFQDVCDEKLAAAGAHWYSIWSFRTAKMKSRSIRRGRLRKGPLLLARRASVYEPSGSSENRSRPGAWADARRAPRCGIFGARPDRSVVRLGPGGGPCVRTFFDDGDLPSNFFTPLAAPAKGSR